MKLELINARYLKTTIKSNYMNNMYRTHKNPENILFLIDDKK